MAETRSDEMIRYGLVLLIICFCASLVLSFTYQMTQAKIEEQLTAEEKKALTAVFPQATSFKDKTLEGKTYYVAEKDDRDLGYVIKAEAKGYSSAIIMLIGFDKFGIIGGMEILSQQETPGLGSKIVEIKAGEDKPWFLRQFTGKNAGELDLKNIQAITAATITSRAVIDSVKKAAEDFLQKIK